MIQIGNGDQKAQITKPHPHKPHPQKQAPPNSHHSSKSNGSTTGSGTVSPDSVSSGGKFQYDAPLSSASSAEPFSTSAVSSTSDLHISPTLHIAPQQQQRRVSQPQEDLAEINRYVCGCGRWEGLHRCTTAMDSCLMEVIAVTPFLCRAGAGHCLAFYERFVRSEYISCCHLRRSFKMQSQCHCSEVVYVCEGEW